MMEEEHWTVQELQNRLQKIERKMDLVRERIWTRDDDEDDKIAIHMGTHAKNEDKQDKPIAWYDEDGKTCYKKIKKRSHYVKGGHSVGGRDEGRYILDSFSLPYDLVKWLSQFGDVKIVMEIKARIVREKVKGQPILRKDAELTAHLSQFLETRPEQLSKDYEHQFFLEIPRFKLVESPQRTLSQFSEFDGRWMGAG